MTQAIRVLVVDDSAVIRRWLTRSLEADPAIRVVGDAADGAEGLRLAEELRPDVITLDVEMPHMDGLTFLRKIMALRPMPVVMTSLPPTSGAIVPTWPNVIRWPVSGCARSGVPLTATPDRIRALSPKTMFWPSPALMTSLP